MSNDLKITIRFQSGISLLEVLVVIVLTGMISTMLLQGITFSLAAFEKTRNYQRQYQKDVLAISWLRNSVENMMASHDPEFSAKGTSLVFTGYSLGPVFRESGELVSATWSLNKNGEDQELWYQEASGRSMLMATWLADSARFSYYDLSGNEHDKWPVIQEELGRIPFQVKLIVSDDLLEARKTIWMASDIRRRPAFDFRDVL